MDYGTETRWRDLFSSPQSARASAQDDGSQTLEVDDPADEATTEFPAIRGPAPVAAPRAAWRRQERVPGWRVNGLRVLAGLPLLAVLVVQAVLSLRLVRLDTAFQDEALYLWAGHLQWAHWLHGAPIPPLAAYFSGAPVIYPPIAALADSIGGLAAARALSLVFMLGATGLLWATASRLFGRRAAFFAAALFAVLGPTLHLGAFATYDAMSMFLVALAAWCVIRAGARKDVTGWMLAAGAALALANAAGYWSVLFDPVVVMLALLIALPKPGGRLAARRIATLLTVLATPLLMGLLIGGRHYITGVAQTTLARVGGSDSALSLLGDAWTWTGVIVVLAVCGVAVSYAGRQRRTQTWLLAVLAIAAGYAASKLIAAAPAGRNRALTSGACVIALAFPLTLGASQSRAFSTSWPNSASFIAILRPLADHGTGRLLVEDPAPARYYLPSGSQWQRWSSTRNIVLPSGASTGGPHESAGVTGPGNPAAYDRFIAQGYFSVVALNFADTTALDHRIAADLRRNPHYHIIQVIPYGIEVAPIGVGTYVIWQYEQSR